VPVGIKYEQSHLRFSGPSQATPTQPHEAKQVIPKIPTQMVQI
jgi:hypothetical protein